MVLLRVCSTPKRERRRTDHNFTALAALISLGFQAGWLGVEWGKERELSFCVPLKVCVSTHEGAVFPVRTVPAVWSGVTNCFPLCARSLTGSRLAGPSQPTQRYRELWERSGWLACRRRGFDHLPPPLLAPSSYRGSIFFLFFFT